jgi:hypothetical protein
MTEQKCASVFHYIGWSFHSAVQGCQIFLGTMYQNGKNIPKTTKYAKWKQNRPNGHLQV